MSMAQGVDADMPQEEDATSGLLGTSLKQKPRNNEQQQQQQQQNTNSNLYPNPSPSLNPIPNPHPNKERLPSFSLQDSMRVLRQDKVSWTEIAKTCVKTVARKYYRTRNSIRNGVWPTSASNLYACCITFYLLMSIEPTWASFVVEYLWRYAHLLNAVLPFKVPQVLAALPLASAVSFVFMCVIMLLRQLALRALLSYRGWMYESMREPPLKIKLWALLVRLISGYQPSLYSFQRCLPRMSVPPLEQTFDKLCELMKCTMCSSPLHHHNNKRFEQFQQDAKLVQTGIGRKLQRLLVVKSWLCTNYVSDWWEKYVYLRARTPLANNCNYYIVDQSYWRATTKPVARAASLVANILRFKQLVDHEKLPPLVLRDTIPICMAQYERLFSTVRVPKLQIDQLVHYDNTQSRHIIVVCRGVYYKLHCYNTNNNKPLCAKTLESYIQQIVDEVCASVPEDLDACCELDTRLNRHSRTIAALTSLERNEWASVRAKLIELDAANANTLQLVESSMFCLWLLIDDSPVELSERARLAFQGNAHYRLWFDKCFNIVVFGNGHCAINCEHSLCDAPAYAHMWEYTLCKDVLECTFDSDGYCFPPMQTHNKLSSSQPQPQRLEWRVDESLAWRRDAELGAELASNSSFTNLAAQVQRANNIALLANQNVDLQVFDHKHWGKGAIKKCHVSPDAFVQLAIQMAYFVDSNGKFVQTYEASMTRLYLNGRTETVRSCTSESCAFVRAMFDASATREQRVLLLHAAARKHTQLYKDAMNGKAIDRHLFALYVASRGLGYECEFLANLLQEPWVLSTSQTPHTQQTNVPDPNYHNFDDKLCAGGGFMAVYEHGYGVSYLFPSDHRIFVHISSRRSSEHTDTKRFGKLLFESMAQIKSLFDTCASNASLTSKNKLD